MTLPVWRYAEETSHYRYRECRRHEDNRPAHESKLLLAIPAIVLLSFTIFYAGDAHSTRDPSAQINPVPLAVSGPAVLVTPGFVRLAIVGSVFTVQIQVNNMLDFDGWDIQVSVDPSVLNATSLSITGNDFAVNASSGTAFEIVHCVNGKGTGCTLSDRPGITHSAYGNTATLTGNGLLFTVTYKVIGNGIYSQLGLVNDLISSPSSGNGVPHTSISGNYGYPFDPVAGAGGGVPARPE